MPNPLPAPRLPHISVELARQVFPSAVTIALLAAIETLLSAVVADGMTGTRHRSNMEVMSQGFANISAVFFGGIPATGAIARTAANIRNGAVSQVAGMAHAITLLLSMDLTALRALEDLYEKTVREGATNIRVVPYRPSAA